MPCHAMPCHAMPCHAMPCHAMPCHAMPCHAMPCHAMPCHAMPCHAMPCHAMPCHAMPCHAMPCHAMPCHAMPCHAMLYFMYTTLKMPCPALPCPATHLKALVNQWRVYKFNFIPHILSFVKLYLNGHERRLNWAKQAQGTKRWNKLWNMPPEWFWTGDPVIRSPAHYLWTTTRVHVLSSKHLLGTDLLYTVLTFGVAMSRYLWPWTYFCTPGRYLVTSRDLQPVPRLSIASFLCKHKTCTHWHGRVLSWHRWPDPRTWPLQTRTPQFVGRWNKAMTRWNMSCQAEICTAAPEICLATLKYVLPLPKYI